MQKRNPSNIINYASFVQVNIVYKEKKHLRLTKIQNNWQVNMFWYHHGKMKIAVVHQFRVNWPDKSNCT